MEHAKKTRIEKNGASGEKKPYAAPRLAVHGDVQAITRTLRLTAPRAQPSQLLLDPDA